MSRTRSNWSLHAFTFIVVFLSFMIIGSSSWLIIVQKSYAPTTGTTSADVDTSPCFTTGQGDVDYFFTAKYQVPELNDVGKAVYGENYSNVTGVEGATEGYTVECVQTTGALQESVRGIMAGTHYYRITDVATGQVISEKHKFVIQKDTFEVKDAVFKNATPSFIGKQADIHVTLVGVHSGLELAYTGKYLVDAADYVSSTTMLVTTGEKTGTVNPSSISLPSGLGIDVRAQNFNPPSALSYKFKCDILPTTYHGNGTTVTTYYGNLDHALVAATGGTITSNTIYAMQSVTYNSATYTATAGAAGNFDHVISVNATIPSGVTLNIPYQAITTDTASVIAAGYEKISGQKPGVYNKTTYAGYYKNAVTINPGVSLTNNGTITIGGVVSGGAGGYSQNSITAGNHARIMMAGDADNPSSITNSGTINCYGYIDESSPNNGSEVVMNSGTLLTVFTINEHRGGSTFMGFANPTTAGIIQGTTGVYEPDLEVFPFNRFYIESVVSKLTVTSNASVKGYAVLFADNATHETTMPVIGSSSEYMIQLATNAKYVGKYDPTEKLHDIDIYGSMTLRPMSLKLTVTKSGVTVNISLSSASAMLPISYHHDVNLKKFPDGTAATVTLNNQDIKVLPGATVVVDAGVTVNAVDLAIYETDKYLNPKAIKSDAKVDASDYNNNTPARFILNGTLNVTNLGGTVDTSATGATLNISGQNTVVSKEFADSYGTALSVSILGKDITVSYNASIFFTAAQCTLAANGPTTYDFVSVTNAGLQLVPYVSSTLNDSSYWNSSSLAKVRYNLTNATDTNPPSPFITNTLHQVKVNSSGLVGDISTALRSPSAKGYAFLGWYTDIQCTNAATAATFAVTDRVIDLYPKWEISDNIVIDVYVDGVVDDQLKISGNLNSANTTLPGYLDTCIQVVENASGIPDRYVSKWVLSAKDSSGNIVASKEYTPGLSQSINIAQYLFNNTYVYEEAIEYDYELAATTAAKYQIKVISQKGTDHMTAATTPTINLSMSIDQSNVLWSDKYTEPTTATLYLAPYQYIKITSSGTKSVTSANNKTYTSYTTVSANDTITYLGKDGSNVCVTPDTLVTMADGTLKEIRNVRLGDLVLAWDFNTGSYVVAPVSLIQNHGAGIINVLYLNFEDGTVVKVLGEHGFYDINENTFVFIDEHDVENYVGHSFVKQSGDGYMTVKLVDYEVVAEDTAAYTILSTTYHNVLLEGMLTVTPAHVGGNFFTPFEVGEGLKYNEAAKLADIEKYGLYTYDEFAHVLTEEQFEVLGIAEFKVAVGKGLITYDGLIFLIETFVNNEDFDVTS